MADPSPQFVAAWQDLTGEFEAPGIGPNPSEELPSSEVEQVNRAYEKSAAAGRERALKAFRDLLERRMDTFRETAEEAAEKSGRAELKNAEAREGPLKTAGARRASVFGRNLDLLYQYLGITYEELSAVTAISKSTLNAFIRERPSPALGSVFQVGTGLGVHPTVLLAGYPELEIWEEAADPASLASGSSLPSEIENSRLRRTTEPMNRLLDGEAPDGEAFDAEAFDAEAFDVDDLGGANGPAEWLRRVEDVAQKLAPYFPSPGGALGAVIGWHHGGLKGAGLAAAAGHRYRLAVEQRDLEGFRCPGPFIESCLRRKLRHRYWE